MTELLKNKNEQWNVKMSGVFLFLVAACHFDMLIRCRKFLLRIWYSVINYSSIFFNVSSLSCLDVVEVGQKKPVPLFIFEITCTTLFKLKLYKD